MKRVLFIAPIDTKDRFKGGITSYAESIITSKELFSNSKIDFVPLNNCLINRRTGTNGKLSFLNFINFIKTRLLISKKLKEQKYDAIYLNTSFGISLLKDLLTLKRRYLKKYQVFLHIHFAGFDNIFTENKLLKKCILKNLKLKTTNIITLSSNLKKELVTSGFKDNKIDVLYNYFDPLLPKMNAEFVSKKISSRGEKTIYLFVGSLEHRKGFYDLIRVFKNIPPSKAKLIICGKPNDNKAQAILNDISDNPVFEYRGYVSGDSKNKSFADSDVLVLPSYGEGLPITILEALNFGLPIVSTTVGAIPEIITNELGKLSEPGDLNSLKNNIESYFDKELLLKMSNSVLKASDLYTFENFSKKLIKIINS